MDKSETYIKMCKKAEEIQGHNFDDGDWSVEDNGFIWVVCTRDFGEWWIGNEVQEFYKTAIWLPRIDQLQEMAFSYYSEIEGDLYSLHTFFNDFIEAYYWHNEYPCEIFKSFEQLWLVYVMKLKGKIWNAEELDFE